MTTKGGYVAMTLAATLALTAAVTFVVSAAAPGGGQHGANPDLPPPQRGLLPSMRIAEPTGWGGRVPAVPQGWTIKAIATELRIPRQTLVLPNGDILVAEGKGGGAPALKPKDYIAGIIKSKGTSPIKGGDRLTLLRDADGDGTYEGRWRQVDASNGATRPFATGLRNPTALAFEPGSRQLWAVVNERDELGPDLVPDYLTSVREGAFYGWPYAYWGANVDRRVQPQDDQKVQATVRPDYALQSHSAPLGLSFVQPGFAGPFAEGAFIGLHGSWNRDVPVGYKVIFIPFAHGRPSGPPVDFVTGFQADGKTMGRPVGVTLDPKGAVIVADDLSNTVWRITPSL